MSGVFFGRACVLETTTGNRPGSEYYPFYCYRIGRGFQCFAPYALFATVIIIVFTSCFLRYDGCHRRRANTRLHYLRAHFVGMRRRQYLTPTTQSRSVLRPWTGFSSTSHTDSSSHANDRGIATFATYTAFIRQVHSTRFCPVVVGTRAVSAGVRGIECPGSDWVLNSQTSFQRVCIGYEDIETLSFNRYVSVMWQTQRSNPNRTRWKIQWKRVRLH